MDFIIINKNNISYIYDFLKSVSSKHFRYYNKRTPENAIETQLYTIIGIKNNEIVSYGHIDTEVNNDNKYWLGICVSDNKTNNGYGTKTLHKLLNWCEHNINMIHLSVDFDNTIAINFYKKYGFILDDNQQSFVTNVHEQNERVIFMKKVTSLYNTIKLDVSYGEALDKLSILEIKLNKIKDERKNDVQKEYDIIFKQIKSIYNNDINYFYYLLKSINLSIWELQDKYRLTTDNNEKNRLCNVILIENDRRFQVKMKINNYLNSDIKEQKGYNKKKAFLYTHQGLGDIINCIGMIRYLSTLYDSVTIVCKKVYHDNIKMLFENDKSINFYLYEKNFENTRFAFNIDTLLSIKNEYEVFLCGQYCLPEDKPVEILPFSFYEHIGLSPIIYRTYSYIPRIIESKQLYNSVININKNYIVTHETSSNGKLFDFVESCSDVNIDEILIINVNRNIYENGHKFYNIAQQCVMKPLLYYVDLIENSLMNLFSDSCMFCLALQLNIKTKLNGYVSRNNEYVHLWDVKYGFDSEKHPKFKIFC